MGTQMIRTTKRLIIRLLVHRDIVYMNADIPFPQRGERPIPPPGNRVFLPPEHI